MATNDALGGAGRFRRGGEGTRRSGARALVFWVVTIAAGLMSAFTITRYLDRHGTTSTTVLTKIVVAALDLPLATKLRPDHVKLVDWPQGALPPGSIRDPKEVVDRIITSRVMAGEPLLTGKLASKDAGNGLAALIPANMRAVAVRVDDVVGVAGFIHTDDRVDVIVTIRPSRPTNAESTSKVILQNVKVLAVGKEIESNERNRNQANPVTVATLLVNPEESEKLALAANEGRLLLTLRSWTDNQTVPTEGMNPSVLLGGDGARHPEAAPPVVAVAGSPAVAAARHARSSPRRSEISEVPPAPPEPRKSDVVEILRGDRFEERKFDAKDKK